MGHATWVVNSTEINTRTYHLLATYAVSVTGAAAKYKGNIYNEIFCNYLFFPITFETFGDFGLNQVGKTLISALGHRIL